MDLAGRRTMSSGDHAEERGLACAIGTDEAADQLFGNIEADILKRRHATKVLAQLLDFKNPHIYSSVCCAFAKRRPRSIPNRAFQVVPVKRPINNLPSMIHSRFDWIKPPGSTSTISISSEP